VGPVFAPADFAAANHFPASPGVAATRSASNVDGFFVGYRFASDRKLAI
jgi:hypothetical protein